MAHKRKGQLTPAPQWWKHLRDWKRVANKRERKAEKEEIKKGNIVEIIGYLSLACGSEVELRKNIASALRAEGIRADVSIRRIDDQQAANLGLRGSPSILIDRKVLQPSNGTGFS